MVDVDYHLVDYIEKKKASGYSITSIRSALVRWGYDKKTIEKSISSVLSSEQKKQGTHKDISFFSKIFFILLMPRRFFTFIAKERSYKTPTFFLFKLLAFVFGLQLVTELVKSMFDFGIVMYGGVLLTVFILFIISICVFSLLFLLIAIILYSVIKYVEGISDYYDVYKVIIYSMAPYVLIFSLSRLPFYNALLLFDVSFGIFHLNIFFIWSLLLVSLGMYHLQAIPLKKSILIICFPIIIIGVVFVLLFPGVLQFSSVFT